MAVSEVRVVKLESWTTTYTERVDGILRDLDRLERRIDRIEDRLQNEERQLTSLERDLRHAEREIDKMRSGRFDIVKLIIAAILGGAITVGISAVTEYIKAAKVEHPTRNASP